MSQRNRSVRSLNKEPELEIHCEELDDVSVDSSIQAVIDQIRKEASRMDIEMALDQIDSLRHENAVVKSSLRQNAVEIKKQEEQLEEMEEIISRLTLERDLLQADTTNLRQDLSTLVDRMFDISCVAGNSPAEESISVNSMNDRTAMAATRASSNSILQELNLSKVLIDMCTSKAIDSSADDLQPFTQRQLDKNHLIESSSSGSKVLKEQDMHNVSGKSQLCASSIVANSESTFVESPQLSTSMAEVTKPGDKLDQHFKRSTHTTKPTLHQGTSDAKRNMISNTIRRYCRRLCCGSRRDEIKAMRGELDQLQAVMKISISTSELLRNKLSVTIHYYEEAVHKLKEQVADMTAEKVRLESKLARMNKENHRPPLKRHESILENDERI
eukprot:scaffold721_cov131-Cylindrotheca_fusiformis.AAC.1